MRLVDRPSPNHNERPGGKAPSILVLHYTGMETAEAALDRLCDPVAQVSAHYTVDEDIYVLDGSAEIDYMGRKFTLRAGESTRFVAGTTATTAAPGPAHTRCTSWRMW